MILKYMLRRLGASFNPRLGYLRLGYKVEILQEFKQLFLTQIQSKSYFLEKGPAKCVKIVCNF